MTNQIHKEPIICSVEMKDKHIKSIFKDSRKTHYIEKFWGVVMEELNIEDFSKIRTNKCFISKTFLKKLKDDIPKDKLGKFVFPHSFEEIDADDFSVYCVVGAL
jgi:hypothetical protein